MLELKNDKGVANTFSLDVYSRVYANTLMSSFSSTNKQYTPNFNSDGGGNVYYIEMTHQLTDESYFVTMKETGDFYPRAKQFTLYLDEYSGVNHVNIKTGGLYNYNVYVSTQSGLTQKTDSEIIGIVSTGIAMVRSDNQTDDHYTNSESGLEDLTIPTTISYNG